MSIGSEEMQIKQQLRYYVLSIIKWDEKPMTKGSLGEDIREMSYLRHCKSGTNKYSKSGGNFIILT